MKIKQYALIASADPEVFLERVNKALDNGYQPYGNPFTLGNSLIQAMVIPG